MIVSPLSKVWAKWLLAGQYANVLLMLLMAFAASQSDVAWLATWKACRTTPAVSAPRT